MLKNMYTSNVMLKIKQKDEVKIGGKITRREKKKKNHIFMGYNFRILLELGENIRNKKVNIFVKSKRILI